MWVFMEQSYNIQSIIGTIEWDKVPILEMKYSYLVTPENIVAFGQICAGKDAFFVHLWAQQPEIRAKEFGADGLPYKDSCLEFFFQPEETNPRYFNLEFNFNKCLFLGIGTNGEDLQRILLDDWEEVFKPFTQRTDQGWEIFYQIPYSFIRRYFPEFELHKGKILRANCFTCSDLAETPYYRSWCRVVNEPLSFHRPECFGIMIIVWLVTKYLIKDK